MSLGALSPEAHETLAIAMNRIGGKSNSGEGGEDPVRYKVLNDVSAAGFSQTLPHLKGLQNGDTASSSIKQVASGRFGVTPEYLMNAKQIEIKIAQGAKPGEGGQLPGAKVSEYIAYLRRSKPGVTLISPPPHHDIYSIEDLAQLIFDLHQINPQAGVSVKLVSEVGIGTVAAGVAKANADVIQISGHDGGTGASPLSSIKHAGSPWELGLTEVHRVLMENKLRDRVLLRVDGGFKSGWDVIVGALMGGEEYGFGTVAMIAEGCIMARVCHMNTCPVGVTTQQEHLRKRFPGTPEHVVNFFYFVAQEVRSLLAKLGYKSIADIIGRADLLKMRDGVKLTKTQAINLDCLTKLPDTKNDRSFLVHEPVHSNGPVLDDDLLADAEIQSAIANHGTVSKSVKLVNTDRTVGARLAGAIAQQHGNTGFSGQITLNCTGSAGQSFGAFNLPGMTLVLSGQANDYVGKGMHGGEIAIAPPAGATYDASENAIVGNTCLYGATGGTLLAAGKAGERFAVRNSMAKAVIEGAGDHCCEYMTGGVIVVLGKVGRNVGAGMTGGLAYFLDEDGSFPAHVNGEIVKMQRVCTAAGEAQLKELIEAQCDRTGSKKAEKILANWSEYLPKFWQVVPPSEANSPEASEQKIAVEV
jgi:glutamate synthase (ferredoxin)